MFDINSFLQDYNIASVDSGYKQCRPGWIQIECPFCKSFPHLGFNSYGGWWNCWKCGWHNHNETIKELTQLPWPKIYEITKEYDVLIFEEDKQQAKIKKKSRLQLPDGTDGYVDGGACINYLAKRNFDWKELFREWGVQATGHRGDYKFRIIIPIYFHGRLVSYQARAIDDENVPKYMLCPNEESLIDRKSILFGMDNVPGDSVVVVEGVFDVFRLGPGAVATFGINYTRDQISLLKNYKRVLIMFDNEKNAYTQAMKLCNELDVLGVEAYVWAWPDDFREGFDPSELSNKDAKLAMERFLEKGE